MLSSLSDGLVAHRLIADDPYCLFQCFTGGEVVVVGFCLSRPPGLPVQNLTMGFPVFRFSLKPHLSSFDIA